MRTPGEMLDLTGRVVIVTGASGSIGAGITGRFSAAGASVVGHARSAEVASLEGPSAEVSVDLTAPEGPATVLRAALESFGRVDALVNNAGIQPKSPLADLDDAGWAEMIDTNVTAVHRLTRVVAALMREQGDGGSIVHIASIEGSQPAPLHGHYATSKAALIMHARAAAVARTHRSARSRCRLAGGRGALAGCGSVGPVGDSGGHRRCLCVPLQ